MSKPPIYSTCSSPEKGDMAKARGDSKMGFPGPKRPFTCDGVMHEGEGDGDGVMREGDGVMHG